MSQLLYHPTHAKIISQKELNPNPNFISTFAQTLALWSASFSLVKLSWWCSILSNRYKSSGSISCLKIYLLKKYKNWRPPYAAWSRVRTLNTWSNSSKVLPFVSGTKKSTPKKPTIFHAAYQENAPCALKALRREGQVTDRTKLKNQVVAVAKDIPRGRMYKG